MALTLLEARARWGDGRSGRRRFVHFYVDARLLEPPDHAHDQLARVAEECRIRALEVVAQELEAPAHGEQAGGQRQAQDRRGDRDAGRDHRDADAVARLVSRVLVLLLVIDQEPGPLA